MWRRFLILSTSSLALMFPLCISALDVVVGDVTVQASETGITHYLDVYLILAPQEQPPEIAGYQVAVDLAMGGEVAFVVPFSQLTEVDHPPLTVENFTPDFAGDNGPGRASALAFASVGTVLGADGSGLVRIPFQISGSTGVFDVVLDVDPVAGTLLSDDAASAIAFTAVDGRIRVVAGTPVPGLSWPGGGLIILAMLCLSGGFLPRIRLERVQ